MKINFAITVTMWTLFALLIISFLGYIKEFKRAEEYKTTLSNQPKYKQLYQLSQQENSELKSKLRYSDSLLNCCIEYDLDCTKRAKGIKL